MNKVAVELHATYMKFEPYATHVKVEPYATYVTLELARIQSNFSFVSPYHAIDDVKERKH